MSDIEAIKGRVRKLMTLANEGSASDGERAVKAADGGGVPADVREEGEAGEQEVPAGVEGEASKKIHLSRKTRRGLALVRMIVMAAFDPSMPTAQTMVDRLKKRDVNEFNQALAWMEQNEDWEAVADRMERMKTGK